MTFHAEVSAEVGEQGSRAGFVRGQAVTVAHVAVEVVNGRVVGQCAQTPFTGTVVGYWRNGKWIVREDANGTTCAYQALEITTREAGVL